ncbi:hypothetical protein [Xenorhabdus szentirmaii]|uniref:Uncharacterized protein n=1 Tax=Xenorhabdus szentirmaii TaxID=290112 RepID=A0AAW3YRH5_9GAMM|nr:MULTISPECIES: hypothetical protein [unclassified Xenorhabdus]MBD2780096.1 hypothetical protein [Xenorhabdus sp. 38]MBD2800665.1 hypothetical protein [Xenorhabdus sp. M]
MVDVRARDDSSMLGDEAKVQMIIGAPAALSVINIEPGFFSCSSGSPIAWAGSYSQMAVSLMDGDDYNLIIGEI